jgi:hypothetical protein
MHHSQTWIKNRGGRVDEKKRRENKKLKVKK